ncbi:hypothetical protein M758_10G037600 [Ceratodon purpureus]|nr:hypothetical protein M758_10G037600 [Ceratodon purpureus]
MATSLCWFLAILAVASSGFQTQAGAGRVALFSDSTGPGGREDGAKHERRSLLEPEHEKPSQVDETVAMSAERRLKDIPGENLHGEVTALTNKPRGNHKPCPGRGGDGQPGGRYSGGNGGNGGGCGGGRGGRGGGGGGEGGEGGGDDGGNGGDGGGGGGTILRC